MKLRIKIEMASLDFNDINKGHQYIIQVSSSVKAKLVEVFGDMTAYSTHTEQNPYGHWCFAYWSVNHHEQEQAAVTVDIYSP